MYFALMTPFVPQQRWPDNESVTVAGGLNWSAGRPLRHTPEIQVDLSGLQRPLPAVVPNVGAIPMFSGALVRLLEGAKMQTVPVIVQDDVAEYLAVNFLVRVKDAVNFEASDVVLDPLSGRVQFLDGFRKLVLEIEDPEPAFRIRAYSGIVILRQDVGERVCAANLPGCFCVPLAELALGCEEASSEFSGL